MPQKLTDVNPQPNNCSNGDAEASINPTFYTALDGENRVNLQGVLANSGGLSVSYFASPLAIAASSTFWAVIFESYMEHL